MFIKISLQYNDDRDAPRVDKDDDHEENDMGDEYKKSMTITMGMLGVPWHSEKVLMKMLYI